MRRNNMIGSIGISDTVFGIGAVASIATGSWIPVVIGGVISIIWKGLFWWLISDNKMI